jgi:hypothetical protein
MRLRKLGAAGLVLFALAGCGDSKGSSSSASTGPASTIEGAQASVATQTTVAQHIAGNPTPQTVGKPFIFETFDNPGDSTMLRITITRPVTCGIRSYQLPPDESVGEPAKTVKPPKGMRFCQVNMTIKNVGKRQVQESMGGNLYDDKDQQFAYDEETTNLVAVAELHSDPNFGSNTIELPPTRQGKTLVVFAIPVGAPPAYMELAELGVTEDINGNRHDARVNIASSDVRWLHPRGT